MTDLQSLYSEILETAKIDSELLLLCRRAEEYARLHLYARKTNGCDSLGELENLLDEFRKMVYEIMRYCGKKGYIDDLAIFTIDVTDEALSKLGADLGEFL